MNPNLEAVEHYLARLKNSLHGVSHEEQEEILTDIRSLIHEHLDGQSTVEAVLQRLGPPEALAEAYQMEGLLSQAAYSSSPLLLIKAALRGARTGVRGFVTALTVLMGYAISLICFGVAMVTSVFHGRAQDAFLGYLKTLPPPGVWNVLGSWPTSVGCLLALFFFVITTLLARGFIRKHVPSFPFDSIS